MTRISRHDVLRYLKLHHSQLRAWEKAGLITRLTTYSLEQYGRLRTLRDLSERLSSSRIRASVGAMKDVAGIDNPLLEMRAIAGGSRVHFRQRGQVTEPIARQFVFNFESDRAVACGFADAQGAPLTMKTISRGEEIAAMFVDAIRHEDAGDFDGAIALYERVLQAQPNHAPSCINLGTISYGRRRFSEAEQLYRRATQADPSYALAFFDLGNVLDELKRLPEAITAYQQAVRLVPGYADAHYNLALAYERTAERRKALRHWTAYLKLDSQSRWAVHARNQVRKLLSHESLTIVHRSARPTPARYQRSGVRAGSRVPTAG